MVVAESQDPWRIHLPVFDGPLDLLLHLIKKEEVDIYDVELGKITNHYLAYLGQMEALNLEVAGEFLVVAAQLIYIKSRTLLPMDQQLPDDDEEDEEDSRWELIRQLVEYKKFKEAAESLDDHARRQEQIFYRIPEPGSSPHPPPPGLGKVEVIDLVRAFQQVLQAARERHGFREIYEDRHTVSEKIEMILDLLQNVSSVRFTDLFRDTSTRGEIVVTFLAVLELIRLKQITAFQTEVFGEIEVRKCP